MKKWMRSVNVLAVAGLAVAGAQSAHADVAIDTFNVTSQSVTVMGPLSGLKSGNNSANAVEAIGGERDIFVQRTSPNIGKVAVDVPSPNPGELAYSNGSQTTGWAEITWDGDDDSATVFNPTGLGGMNLQLNGETGIRLTGGSDRGSNLVLSIYTDANYWSQASLVLPQNTNTPLSYASSFIPWGSFTAMGSLGGAAFNNVGAIKLYIDGATPDTDVTVVGDLRATNAPEPGTMALLGLGGLGMLRKLRRRRQDA